jgi:methionyl-tRNA formyltransferase
MNVGFAGTPAFAATVLAALLDAGFAVPLALTQPDRPRGRGLREEPSPVKRLALERGVPVRQPATLVGETPAELLREAGTDVLAVAAYGLLLPPPILAVPPLGCLNVHASLLPRWRGAAPVQRAILAGDAETGVAIMQMEAGLDTGPTLDVARVRIGARETAGLLEARLAAVGARLLVGVLRRLAAGESVPRQRQPATGVTYARKIDRSEAAIDWTAPAMAIDRQVRAFDPAPGAYTVLSGTILKVWRAEPDPLQAAAPPGTVLDADPLGLVVACGEGSLRLLEVQPAGARRMSAAAFIAGRRLARGVRLGTDRGA